MRQASARPRRPRPEQAAALGPSQEHGTPLLAASRHHARRPLRSHGRRPYLLRHRCWGIAPTPGRHPTQTRAHPHNPGRLAHQDEPHAQHLSKTGRGRQEVAPRRRRRARIGANKPHRTRPAKDAAHAVRAVRPVQTKDRSHAPHHLGVPRGRAPRRPHPWPLGRHRNRLRPVRTAPPRHPGRGRALLDGRPRLHRTDRRRVPADLRDRRPRPAAQGAGQRAGRRAVDAAPRRPPQPRAAPE